MCEEAASARAHACIPGPRWAFGLRGPLEVWVVSQLGARLRLSRGSEVLISPCKAAPSAIILEDFAVSEGKSYMIVF